MEYIIKASLPNIQPDMNLSKPLWNLKDDNIFTIASVKQSLQNDDPINTLSTDSHRYKTLWKSKISKKMQVLYIDHHSWTNQHHGSHPEKVSKHMPKPKLVCTLQVKKWRYESSLPSLWKSSSSSGKKSRKRLGRLSRAKAQKLYACQFAISDTQIGRMLLSSIQYRHFYGQYGWRETIVFSTTNIKAPLGTVFAKHIII